MRSGFRTALAVAITMASPSAGASQAAPAPQVASAQVTLSVPIDLSQLSPDITKVVLDCVIGSPAITNGDQFNQIRQSQDIPVSGGVVRTTATVVFNFTDLNNPKGQTANVGCDISGWSASLQKKDQFHPAQTQLQFRTTAQVSSIATTFVW